MNSGIQLDPAEEFFSGAIDRVRRITIVLGIASTIVVWAIYGTAIGIGFLIGCAISYINFHWLKRAIEGLTLTITQSGYVPSSRGVVLRFLLRYGFILIACCVILIGSKSSVYGLLGGLFVTVAAILCEAVYEAAVALRRGI
jgi:hypothetical protein